MEKYLIIDIGTSSLRVAVLDAALQLVDTRSVKRRAPATFDAEAEWAQVQQLIGSLTAEHTTFRAAAVSALLGWVFVDEAGKAVTPCYTYMHQEPEVYRAFAAKHGNDELYPICRRRINPEQPAFKLRRIRSEEPQLYASARWLLSLKDYINMKLTGRAAMDHTSAAYTLLYDVQQRGWSDHCLSILDLDTAKLPELVDPWQPLGDIRPEIAQAIGLERSCPVAAGSSDGSTGILGAGGMRPATMISVMGTTDTAFVVEDHITPDPTGSLVVNPHVIPGLYLAGGPMGLYGGTLDWLIAGVMHGCSNLKEMDRLAADIPAGSGGVVMLAALAGERAPLWLPELQGSILGLTPDHRAEHVYRAVMEANSYILRYMAGLITGSGSRIDQVLVTGGGSYSDLWLRIKVDVLGVPVARSDVREATLAGACLLAMIACGIPVEELPAPSSSDTFQADREAAETYNRLYRDYMALYHKVAALYPLGSRAQ